MLDPQEHEQAYQPADVVTACAGSHAQRIAWESFKWIRQSPFRSSITSSTARLRFSTHDVFALVFRACRVQHRHSLDLARAIGQIHDAGCRPRNAESPDPFELFFQRLAVAGVARNALRAPTTAPCRAVANTPALIPNSYDVLALPLPMHFIFGACTDGNLRFSFDRRLPICSATCICSTVIPFKSVHMMNNDSGSPRAATCAGGAAPGACGRTARGIKVIGPMPAAWATSSMKDFYL